MNKLFSSVILFSFIVLSSCQHKPVDVYDDFEASTLNTIWDKERMETHSFEIQSAIHSSGNHAAKITLRSGDKIEKANDSSLASERDELIEQEYLYAEENKTYEYKFSMFLPDSFPIVPTRLVIAQWKEKCPGGKCEDDSPVIGLRYRGGKLFVTFNTKEEKEKLFETDEEVRNKWLHFKFTIKFSQKNDGIILAELNDKSILNYHGITSYSPERDYKPSGNKYYFKMGLYRDRMPQPMSIYIDDYRKKELTN